MHWNRQIQVKMVTVLTEELQLAVLIIPSEALQVPTGFISGFLLSILYINEKYSLCLVSFPDVLVFLYILVRFHEKFPLGVTLSRTNVKRYCFINNVSYFLLNVLLIRSLKLSN